jgi:hypothetical protein
VAKKKRTTARTGSVSVSNKPSALFLHQPSQGNHFCELGRIRLWNRDLSAEAFRSHAFQIIGVFQHLKVEHRNLWFFAAALWTADLILDHDSLLLLLLLAVTLFF